jgi:hypothetical protein
MCLLLIGIAFPRLVLLLLFFFTNFLWRAYHHSLLLPVLGFFFLPLTTLVYAWIVNTGGSLQGLYIVAIVICVMADLGLLGHTARSRRD